jgi:hypothetical protein
MFLASSLVACEGAISSPAVLGPTGVQVPVAESLPPEGFTVPQQAPKVLPFAVRFARLQAVTGAGPDDAMFTTLLANRTSLGDYDYANGTTPFAEWTALRHSQWVEAVKPVCESAQMRQRFGSNSFGALMEASYGRATSADDTAAVTESLTGLTLSAEEQRTSLCLAIFSSMEFTTL